MTAPLHCMQAEDQHVVLEQFRISNLCLWKGRISSERAAELLRVPCVASSDLVAGCYEGTSRLVSILAALLLGAPTLQGVKRERLLNARVRPCGAHAYCYIVKAQCVSFMQEDSSCGKGV